MSIIERYRRARAALVWAADIASMAAEAIEQDGGPFDDGTPQPLDGILGSMVMEHSACKTDVREARATCEALWAELQQHADADTLASLQPPPTAESLAAALQLNPS